MYAQRAVCSAGPRGLRGALSLLVAMAIATFGVGCGGESPPDVVPKASDAGAPDAGATVPVAENPNAPTDCTVGTLECACAPGGGCALSPDGEQLSCVAGVCLLPVCPPGQLGCACRASGSCDQGSCSEGFCVNEDCAPGTLHCSCAFGGCDVGLLCQEGVVCIDQTGHEGGACFDNGTCTTGNRCDVQTDRCVFCELGSEGCHCNASGGCGEGLRCSGGLCLARAAQAPEDPRCYTPCRGDLDVGADVRECGSDNLMDGCLDDQVCTDGSCLLPGQPKPSCSSDLDCPFFQACLEGGCYSNCETSLDCPTGLGCHDRVCRTPCLLATGTAACGGAQTCDSDDGQTGFCVPIRPPPAVSTPPPGGTAFDVLAHGTVALSNLDTAAVIRLKPRGTASQQVTVRKLSHRMRLADGSIELIETPVDEATGLPIPCEGSSTQCPLWWLELGDGVTSAVTDALTLTLPGGCNDDCPVITLKNAGGSPAISYEGQLLVSGPGGSHEVNVQYFQDVAGRWQGEIHYFTNFHDEGVKAWAESANKDNVSEVKNGLLQRWGAFRRGNLEGYEEIEAVLTATRTGSWKQPQVEALCDAVTGGSERAACYPFSNPEGVRRYVQNVDDAPIPGESTELPIALNLRRVDDGGTVLTGRIDSTTALQYPNHPAISLQLVKNPALPGACDPDISSECVVFLKAMKAEVALGGRYISEGATCAPGYTARTVPWLVPGLSEGTHSGLAGPARTECRESSLPFMDPERSDENADLAGANPVPDGKARLRRLELLDGALINQSRLLIFFRESFASFLPAAEPVDAYGFMVLTRSPADLDDEELIGYPVEDVTRAPPPFGAGCPADNFGFTDPDERALFLLDGSAVDDALVEPTPLTDLQKYEQVHYLCAGRFDATGTLEEVTVDPFGGADPPPGSPYLRKDGQLYFRAPSDCLPGDEVTFFLVDPSKLSAFDVVNHACNTSGTCRETLNQWIAAEQVSDPPGRIIDADPVWRCEDPTRAVCDDELDERRYGKDFYRRRPDAPSSEQAFPPLAAAVESAFRFKTRFVSGLDEDAAVGFAPVPCVPGSDAYPYCYAADEIEATQQRVDCLLDMYSNARASSAAGGGDRLSASTQARVDAFLRGSFAETPEGQDGFERLYAELVVMLGDEELTDAFASRFDLAGVDTDNFEGAAFERDGINLSGVAGAEMTKLHRAIQYYELVLDRFYRMGPHFQRALALGDTSSPKNLISPQTVTLYLPRVVRAAAQKALAWSEVAKRYRDFNRPELARRVLERAYATTYLESALIGRMMLDISARSQGQFRDQIAFELQSVQRTLRVALLDMREVFEEVSRGSTYFGYPPEYVPFPAVDTQTVGNNGFEILLSSARTKLQTAKEREQIAFDSLIQSRLDVAQFQGELVRVRNNHEDQLADLCGTFTADDGARLPAIKKYAGRSAETRVRGDPCGMVANGRIHEQMLQIDMATAALDGVLTRYRNARQGIHDEQTRVAEQCNLAREQARYEYEQGAAIRDLETALGLTQATLHGAVRGVNLVRDAVEGYAQCTLGQGLSIALCSMFRSTAAGFGVLGAVIETSADFVAVGFQAEIATKRLETARWVTEGTCQVQLVDAARTMAQQIRELDEITLEALRSQIALQLEVTELMRMRNEANRLQERQAEAEQHLIDVEAARNDPNVRIFRNEAIINADIAFDDAIRAAYRATRMYEFYTSTSYARLEQLFIVRLAAKGTLNLENYLIELENAFADFEEEFGLPDARVAIYSLRDDVLQVPFIDENGKPLGQADRIAEMQRRLNDPARLDKNGYITIPFGTGFEQLSPLTRNHKLRYIEVNIIGSNVGDRLGRVYLRQRGTSLIQTVDDATDYYVFPARTAVVDAFFNGNRVLPPEVYRNERLRDRPVVNTMWELVINRRDEGVNSDIDLGSLTDIQILFHYTDFTVF